MNEQAVKDWVKALPREEGDNCVILIGSDEYFAFKVEATVGGITEMLLNMSFRNPDFLSAIVATVTRLMNHAVEGGEE